MAQAEPAAARAKILRKWNELMLKHQEDLARLMTAEQGKPLAEAMRRDRLCRRFLRVVWRGSKTRLWRHHPRPHQRPPHHGAETACRRCRRDHTVELPDRDDHAESRPRHRRWLHRRAQALRTYALFRARPRCPRRGSGPAAGRAEHRHRRCGADRPRADGRPAHREVHVHGLDTCRQETRRAMRWAR